jgi:hypothetical protein
MDPITSIIDIVQPGIAAVVSGVESLGSGPANVGNYGGEAINPDYQGDGGPDGGIFSSVENTVSSAADSIKSGVVGIGSAIGGFTTTLEQWAPYAWFLAVIIALTLLIHEVREL